MRTEADFSRWLCGCLRNHGAFVQRIETTTGNGVPDLLICHKGKTYWIELKWKTQHIRPEQYVWGIKAPYNVIYLVGDTKSLQWYTSENIEPKKSSYKLQTLQQTYPRTTRGVEHFLSTL